MALHSLFLFTLLITFSSFFHGLSAVKYEVINNAAQTPGGIRFEKEIGVPYTLEIMAKINDYVYSVILKQSHPLDRKPVEKVICYISEYKGAEAIVYGDNVNVSSVYLEGYHGNVKWEFTSLLYHEITHVFQWNGEGKAPTELVEGIADYTILKANYYPPAFAKPGSGDRWDQGYDFTARFLEYCDGLTPDFVPKLNKKMRYTWDVKYFEELTGKPVDQLWKEYKAKHGQ